VVIFKHFNLAGNIACLKDLQLYIIGMPLENRADLRGNTRTSKRTVARFDVIVTVIMNIIAILDMAPCCLVQI
jgi:hypothetical protein